MTNDKAVEQAHRHKVKHEVESGFTWCAYPPYPYPCNPPAHGEYTLYQQCACGATRQQNVNGLYVEANAWSYTIDYGVF